MERSSAVLRGEREARETDVVGADRVLAILKVLAEYPDGATLAEIAAGVDAAKSTVHRGLASLKRAKLVEQTRGSQYQLGDELLRIAFAFHDARPDTVRVRPILERLSEHFGEATHYAVLDGQDVVYRAKVVPKTEGIQLTSTIGGRNPAHCTAVGKLLLATTMDDDDLIDWIEGAALSKRTPNTITDPSELAEELAAIRARGWATENEESEFGICCLAVPYNLGTSGRSTGAISVSAVAFRTPLATLVADVDLVLGAARDSESISADEPDGSPGGS